MIQDRRARKDKEKAMAASSTASDVGVSGAGAGSDRVPFHGGPAYPMDAEDVELARKIYEEMQKKRLRELQRENAVAEERAPAFGDGGGDSDGGAATGAGAGPAVTGPASDKDKEDSGSGSSSSRRGVKYNKVRACCFSVWECTTVNATCQLDTDLESLFLYKYPQPASEPECIGIQELARGVGKAWERAGQRSVEAKKRGEQDPVYNKLTGGRAPSGLGLVQYLVDIDDEFQPGDWYTSSKFANLKNGGSFGTKIRAVEGSVTGWSWESWKST